MRILIVSQYFWPENFRINDLCSELSHRGHKVTVLTGKPNYPDGNVFEDFQNKPKEFDQYAGCRIFRVPMIERGDGNSTKLILNYFSYAVSATLIGAWKLRGKKFDVIFVFEPSPVTVGLPAIFFKKIKKAPIVFWVLDLWPETLEAVGIIESKRALGFIGKLVSFIYNRCDLVLGQSEAFFEGISKYCQDRTKIKYFPSWSENIFSQISVHPATELEKHSGVFKILFAGNIGESQDFPSILKAMEILKAEHANVKLFLVGDGRNMNFVNTEVLNRNLNDYVYLLGRHPLKSMPSFYTAADVLLVTLKQSPVFSMTIPGKIQSYMSVGKPILTMLSGEGSRIVKEADCGYIANSGNSEKLAQNIIKMSQLSSVELGFLGSKAKSYADSEFNRDKLINQLENWLNEMVDKEKREEA